MIKKKYDELAKKHKLPKYEELDEEFEISTIEHEEFLIREIRRKMQERADYIADALNSLLQPDPGSLSNMTEYNALEDSEREEASKLFKDIMVIKRKAESAAFSSEEEQAGYIREALEKWKENKGRIRQLFARMAESWQKEEKACSGAEYMG